jgi:hypothetical protein
MNSEFVWESIFQLCLIFFQLIKDEIEGGKVGGGMEEGRKEGRREEEGGKAKGGKKVEKVEEKGSSWLEREL